MKDSEEPSLKELLIRIQRLETRVNVMFDTIDKIGIRNIAEVSQWWSLVKKEQKRQDEKV